MSRRQSYTLNAYIKAIEILRKGKFGKFEHGFHKGSRYNFKLFEKDSDVIPCNMWNIHFGHSKKREIWSGQDLKKAAAYLGISLDVFIGTIEEL